MSQVELWEYVVYRCDAQNGLLMAKVKLAGKDKEVDLSDLKLTDAFNLLGGEGWELAAAVPLVEHTFFQAAFGSKPYTTSVHYTFKRRKVV